ncbi:9234_t:CDS:10 [Acaulospora colombiana]|uniref:9234_t:CDS:1 n=1 Tax=Acaulospora colombiana TaxID=27376 RepID=A0ACA9KNS6_9GLOM|nr:9234_t:CDS:10 [Acaulospora colombiana]
MATMATSPTNATTQTPVAGRGPSAGQKVNASESTLIHGTEGEQVKPIQGEKEIQEKIQELDLDNCRVLVTNVDSQSSLNGGIVIQVLGEMSNRSESSRKFAQTFFLAEQPNGYYVMNDIIRFLKEDDEVDEEGDEIETETRPTIEEAVTNYVNDEELGSNSPTGTLVEEPINGRTVSETVREVTITVTSGQFVTPADEAASVAVNDTEAHEEVQTPINAEPTEVSSTDNVMNVDQPRSIPEVPRPVHSAKQASVVANVSGQTQSMSSNVSGPAGPAISQIPTSKPVNESTTDVPQNSSKQPPSQTSKPVNSQTTSTKPPLTPTTNSQPANTKQPAPNVVYNQNSRSSHTGPTYAQRSAPSVHNGQYNQASRLGGKQTISQQTNSLNGLSISPSGNGQITPDAQRPVSPTTPSSESVNPTTSVQQTSPSGEDSTSKSTVANGQPATSEVNVHGDLQKNNQDLEIASDQNVQVETLAAALSSVVTQQGGTQQQKSQDQPAVKTWANLAANDHTKWSNALAEKKGHVASVPAPAPKSAPPQQRQHARDNQDRRQDGARGNNRRNSVDTSLSIYVKGVTTSMTREQLNTAFKAFGAITNLDVVHSKSCAFVEYQNVDSYKAALNAKAVKIGNESVFTEERRGDELRYKNLSKNISQQIFTITSNMTSIRNLVGYLGTAKDTPDVRTKLHNLTERTRDLVKDTSNNIKNLSHFESTSVQNRHRKVEQEKLSKDFQKTLQEFQKVQRLSAEKQREYVDKAKVLNVRNDVYDEDSGIPEEQPLIDDSHRRLQLQVLDNEIEYNESLIAEREVEIREIEQGINELNEIFRDLGTLVTEHQTMLDNIESNVTNIAVNVRNAADELSTASRYQKKARNRMCCLMLIFAVVGGVVVLAALT